ncbi:hypothetical protein JD969_20345 [Planctomycetota bacterium]|nr:hypothetical protein JD969_20345 [Planctomycetota bacterium]
MLKLATLIENPGEPLIDSRYHDPNELKALGYNGIVVYPTTALSGISDPDVIQSVEYKRWINSHFQRVDQEISDAVNVGLDVYLFYDMLVLPTDLVEMDSNAINCKNRSSSICPASQKAYDLSMQALSAQLGRWPQVAGIVARIGDSDATRLPFLSGNDIYSPYCPRCSSLNKLDRVSKAIQSVFDTVVKMHQKRLIVRAWNVRPNGLHDSKDLAQKLVDRLPKAQKDQLMISFKFTNTDFWRYQSWNKASQTIGEIPILYEFQCQREFEGKGSAPNWQAPIWKYGMDEVFDEQEPLGLANASHDVNVSGSIVWVRGGGWGGPFINNEMWVDANVYAASKLTDDPQIDLKQLSKDWCVERLGLENANDVEVLSDILEKSADTIRHAFYIKSYAEKRIDGWHPNADWIQDDVFDAEALWRLISRADKKALSEIVNEKKLAVEKINSARASLQSILSKQNQSKIEPLVSSMIYYESLIETISHLVEALVAYRMFKESKSNISFQVIMQHILTSQNRWNHHTQRVPTLPGSPTPYREKNFWELTQGILSEIQSM